MKQALFLLLIFSFVYSEELDESYWEFSENIVLKKDQMQVYLISDASGEYIKELRFTWTLFANNGLVINLNYDGLPSQFILYRKNRLDIYRVQLFSPNTDSSFSPYMLIIFDNFSFRNKEANFKIVVKDLSNTVVVRKI